jgi:hypothetical protein
VTQRRPGGIGDRYHRYIDRKIRGDGGPGNGSQFLFELGARLDPAMVRARLDALDGPWDAIPLEVEVADSSPSELFNAWFAKPFPRPGGPEPLEVVVGQHGDRGLLLLRWNHALMDAPGADLLVRMLDGEPMERFRLHDQPPTLWKRVARKGLLANIWTIHANILRFVASSFPSPVQRRVRADEPPPRVRFAALDEVSTARIDRRTAKLAGPLEGSHYLLACAARAVAAVLGVGERDRLLIPCPLDVRPPAWRGPVFTNYFTSVLLRLKVGELASPAEAVDAVKRRFRQALRQRQDVSNLFMMGMARFLPYPAMRLLMEGPTLRDPASLYYSKVDLKAAADGTLLGLPVRSARIASSVVRRPGITILFCRCAGALTVSVVGAGFDRDDELRDRLVDLLLGRDD